MSERILFLSWESPWPPLGGAGIRRWGLLGELGKAYPLELLVLSRRPLSGEQTAKLGTLARKVTRVPLRDVSVADKVRALARMIVRGLPYHSAVLVSSLRGHPDVLRRVVGFPGIVITSVGHWGALIRGRRAPGWILNQCDADVDFWRVYASQARHPLVKAAAWINRRLSMPLFRRVYRNAGRIISVCEEDGRLTLELAPGARVDVIKNGVDCSYYVPHARRRDGQPPRLLFTGTSAARNVAALRWFTDRVWPRVRERVPGVELLVGGDFNLKSRRRFRSVPDIRFTGRVDDIRPCFDKCQVYISPFAKAHGTKVKIAEAMAMGMAIVSLPGGIRGYPLLDGRSVLIARTPQAFADGCVRLLGDASLRGRLGGESRRIAEKTLDWKVLGARLRAIVDEQRSRLDGAPGVAHGMRGRRSR